MTGAGDQSKRQVMLWTEGSESRPPPPNAVAATGRWVLTNIQHAGRAVLVLVEAGFWLIHLPLRRKEVGRQLYTVGIRSFGVTSTVALFTGMILSLQAGLILKDYGQEVNVGMLVAQTMCREMGPFMTALILAASVGSAMAATLGTMTVSEEIDALQVMSINPVRYLVMPRLFAMMVMCPALTVYTNIIGTLGGGLVAKTQLAVPWSAYYHNVLSTLGLKEIYVGLFKAFVFGIIVAGVGCYQGLATRGGAVGVGVATRRAVVISFLLVLIAGYFITRLFY
jgi:phospholipid/cholesterol/gamma-HCH transport system permease protein